MAKVFEAADIDGVVIALGGKTKDVGETMCTDGTVAVMDAMKTKGVKRVSIVSVSNYRVTQRTSIKSYCHFAVTTSVLHRV